jgi:hypothetical protein
MAKHTSKSEKYEVDMDMPKKKMDMPKKINKPKPKKK